MQGMTRPRKPLFGWAGGHLKLAKRPSQGRCRACAPALPLTVPRSGVILRQTYAGRVSASSMVTGSARVPSDPQLGPPSAPLSDDPTNLANAFTRRGLVKSFWNLNGSEGQPLGPAPPDPGTDVIPDGTMEPTTASWEAEPVGPEPPVGQNRLDPFR
jgi:hypothetical protein